MLRTVLLEESKMFYSTKMISPAAKSASTRLSVEHFEPAQAHGLGHLGGASQDLNSMASCPQLVTAMLDAASSSSSLWVIVDDDDGREAKRMSC